MAHRLNHNIPKENMMATNNVEVMVNVDKMSNEALSEFAQNFYKKTGLRLQHVSFDWLAVTTPAAADYILGDVVISTTGRAQ